MSVAQIALRRVAPFIAGSSSLVKVAIQGTPEMENSGEKNLLARVAAGDESAVRECVDRFGGLVWSLARRWSVDNADAEDAVQEVFLDLWKSAHRYRPSKASDRGFVAMIARRRLIDRARKRDRRPTLEPFPEGFDAPGQDHVAIEQIGRVEKAKAILAQLSPDQREVLELSLLEGLPHQEISERTGMPLGTVKSHIRRGLKKARDMAAESNPAQGEVG
ncbi:MAG: sigma-70 family RNA polymerase sigma factor [Gemmatimonadota bacterium]|jgi:RNA polymerase sigma-70 factor (ECF subfamily)